MFDKEQFVADCRAALDGPQSARNVREVVARAVSDPEGVLRGLGEPKGGGIVPIHRSADLTVINVLWPVNMVIMPHNHNLWAAIGVYVGREDNILWRRLPAEAPRGIEAAGAKALSTRDALAFGPDLIHSVVNPSAKITGAIHVYGGDFFAIERSEWDPDSLQERPFDVDKAQRMFARQGA
jgi:predicted metal-dependent enzyme (double-stranded beta helix superfamily)